MNLKFKKLSSILMLIIMMGSIFSPYTSLSATTVTSEVVTSETTELEESSEITSETIFVENIDEYSSLIDNESEETLVITKENLLKQTRASYNVEKYPHPTLMIDDFSNHWGQLMYFRVNGDLVFCIESTKDINNIAYDQSESQSYYYSLSQNVRLQIEYISAYGISKYQDTGNKDYLWATQLLIWKAIEPSKYNLSGGTSLQQEINEIFNLANEHFKIPSFMGTTTNNAPTHKLKWNGTKYTITLTDTNNVANYKLAELGSTYGDYTISKSGNSITISTSNHNASKKSIVPKYTPYNAGSNKYYDGGQDIFQGSADPLAMYMNVEIEPALGKIQLLKVGSKNCDKSITKPGEIKDCQTVLGNVDFNVYNDLNANGKLDEKEDSEFNIVETITTNENGVATSGNLSLKPYLVREAKSLENYFINEYAFPVTLTEPNKVVQLNNGIAIENVEKLGQVKITKTGNEIGNLNDELVFLSNAEYTIYKRTLLSEDETGLDVNNELESEIDSDLNEVDTDSLYEDEIVAVLTTDMNGNAISPLLSFGNYYIQETNAPDGYVLDETEYDFTIDNDTYSEVIEFSFEDEVITNEIEITKTDLATGDELAGAKLQVLDTNGTIVEEWISTTEPHLFNLEFGDYIIMEEFAPEGYLPLLEGVKFSVTEDGIVQSFKIDNKLITNEISITKTDLATGDELAGARLQVLDSKGSIVEEWTSTTEAHEFTLPYGDYIIMEEFAPEGYLPLLEGVKFSVTEDGVKQSFKIENELMPVIEETGQNSYILIIFVSLIILVVLKYAINIRKAIPKLGETNE